MAFAQGRLVRRTRGFAAGALLVVAAIAWWAGADPAGAQSTTVSCAVVDAGLPGPSGDRLDISFSDFDTVEVERTGQRIRIKTGDTDERFRLVGCSGPTATLTSIDQIALTVFPNPEFSAPDDDSDLSADVVLDLQEGALAPGATDEGDGGSEIELSLAAQGGRIVHADVAIQGSPLAENLSFDAAGANLNAAEPAADLDFPGGADTDFAVYAGDGNDVLRSTAQSAFLGEKGDDTISQGIGGFSTGGRGNDTMLGGAKGDLLLGGPGADSISSGGGSDLVVGGPGADRIDTGPGRDASYTADSSRDRVRCGPSVDFAGVDRRDRRRGCERFLFLRGTPRLFD